MAQHSFMDGRLHVYKRPNSRYWQCSTFLNGRNHRTSTKEESLEHAKDFAEDWYLELRGKHRAGLLKTGKTFREAAAQFELEYEVITEGQRSPYYVQSHKDRLRVHLLPFFGDMILDDINAGTVQQYRVHRHQNPVRRRGQSGTEPKTPARATIHHEIVTLRQVLKTADRHGWLKSSRTFAAIQDLRQDHAPRVVFAARNTRSFTNARANARRKPKKKRWKRACEQLHDYVLFMANTGLRPDEAKRLEYRDVEIVSDEATGETILEIEVRGKRGVGYCKSMPGAVRPFKRLVASATTRKPTDRLFPGDHRELFNTILEELNLKIDRDGNRRTAYSLRHTYICLRLMEGADIYQIAKNCRTSVEMIEKYYAAHIAEHARRRRDQRPQSQSPSGEGADEGAKAPARRQDSVGSGRGARYSYPCGRGGTGRRAGLKNPFRKECRFDSDRPHQLTILVQRCRLTTRDFAATEIP